MGTELYKKGLKSTHILVRKQLPLGVGNVWWARKGHEGTWGLCGNVLYLVGGDYVPVDNR